MSIMAIDNVVQKLEEESADNKTIVDDWNRYKIGFLGRLLQIK